MPTKRWMTGLGIFALAFLVTGCGGGGGGGGSTPPPQNPVPAISLAPSSLTFSAVQGGSNPASQTITVKNSGSSGSTLNYSVTKTQSWLAPDKSGGSLGAGGSDTISAGIDISGLTAGSYTDSITVSATGASNSPQAVAVTLTIAPVPVINSVSPAEISCPAECFPVYITVKGSNLTASGTLYVNDASMPYVVSGTNLVFTLSFDQSHYLPKRGTIMFANAAGAKSNTKYISFLGSLNTQKFSATDALQLDQADPNTPNGLGNPSGAVYKFGLSSDGGSDGKLAVGGLVRGIGSATVSGANGSVDYGLTAYSNSIGVWRIADGYPTTAFFNSSVLGVAGTTDGYGCAAAHQSGLLVGFDLTPLPNAAPTFMTIAIGDTPWDVAMTKFAAAPACVVYNAGDSQLSVVKIPVTTLWNSTTLTGLTPMGKIANAWEGGWQLAVLEISPTVKIAAVLSQYDQKVVLTKIALDNTGNLISFTDLGTVDIAAIPSIADYFAFRITADNAGGTFRVALDDNSAGLTRFIVINPAATGATTTLLTATTAKLAVGLGVSPLDGKTVACEQSACDFLPNQ